MFKFFRRIRQNEMFQNKISKYLLYAIGEIILVVIGILIALSLNNWKEDRDTDQRKIALLENIQSDYRKNKARLLEAKEESRQINSDIRHFIKLISTEHKTAPIDTLIKYGSSMISVTSFSPLNSSYVTAQSTGDIGLIKDKEILELFIEFQEALDWLNFHVELSGDMVYSGSIARMRERLGSFFVLLKRENSDPYPTAFRMTEEEYRSFFQIKENFSALESMYWINRNVLRSLEEMIIINDEILLRIDSMLSNS